MLYKWNKLDITKRARKFLGLGVTEYWEKEELVTDGRNNEKA